MNGGGWGHEMVMVLRVMTWYGSQGCEMCMNICLRITDMP